MRAIVCEGQELAWKEVPDPVPAPGEVLVTVKATAVNRADLLQRRGFYPPPPGAPDTLGLECAGTTPDGRRVMALLPGGGYAEKVSVPSDMLMEIPEGWSFTQAAAFPEVWFTAFDNLLGWGRLAAGEMCLIQGGASGVGTAAIQLACWQGATCLVTCGTPAKGQACMDLGASGWFDYKGDWPGQVMQVTGGKGVDVILDVVGGPNLGKNVGCLATQGRLVVIGLQGGVKGELNLGLMLSRRLTLMGTTLRARPLGEKVALTRKVVAEVLPAMARGDLRLVIDRVLPITRAAEAHAALERGDHTGKIVLEIP